MLVRNREEALEALADVLEYPSPRTPAIARSAAAHFPGGEVLGALADWVEADPHRAEERYSTLFDMDPKCTLSVGFHLFGEEYNRGVLLSQLRMELHKVGLLGVGELPDHLATLLRLLARLETDEDQRLLVEHLLQPGLEKMREALADANDPYPALVSAVDALITSSTARDPSDARTHS